MDIEHEIHREGPDWVLLVAQPDLEAAHHQLTSYWRENAPSRDQPVTAITIDSGWAGVIGYLLVIWWVPVWQLLISTSLTNAGRLDAAAVQAGEWWRVATALTLHADIAHIAANSLFGTVFGLFVGRYLGSGFGWLMVLLCGMVANALNAWVQPDGFRAIGASTATFAALGIVPGYGWRKGFFRGRGAKRGFAPIFAAIALFSFTGFGSERVDVLGHLFGFGCGLGMGSLLSRTNIASKSQADHWRAGFVTVGILVFAWSIALT